MRAVHASACLRLRVVPAVRLRLRLRACVRARLCWLCAGLCSLTPELINGNVARRALHAMIMIIMIIMQRWHNLVALQEDVANSGHVHHSRSAERQQ